MQHEVDHLDGILFVERMLPKSFRSTYDMMEEGMGEEDD